MNAPFCVCSSDRLLFPSVSLPPARTERALMGDADGQTDDSARICSGASFFFLSLSFVLASNEIDAPVSFWDQAATRLGPWRRARQKEMRQTERHALLIMTDLLPLFDFPPFPWHACPPAVVDAVSPLAPSFFRSLSPPPFPFPFPSPSLSCPALSRPPASQPARVIVTNNTTIRSV